MMFTFTYCDQVPGFEIEGSESRVWDLGSWVDGPGSKLCVGVAVASV